MSARFSFPSRPWRFSLHTWWHHCLEPVTPKGPATSLFQGVTLPLAGLYGLVASARRALYQRGWLKVKQLPALVVSVGNLSVGGTGKTPVTAALALKLQAQGLRVVILSRGYGGRDRNVTCISDGRRLYHRPPRTGDEPYWLARNLPGVPVYTCPCRYKAGLAAWEAHHPDIFLLDDGFQHYQLHRDLDIVLLDADAPYGNSRLLPAGTLREPPHTLSLAQVLVLTRFDPYRHHDRLQDLARTFPHKLLLTAAIDPAGARLEPDGRECAPHDLAGLSLFAFAALARPLVFLRTLTDLGVCLTGFQPFPDHHPYSAADLDTLIARARDSGAKALITTAKDWARLGEGWSGKLPLWILEVKARLTPESPLIGKIALMASQIRANPALVGTTSCSFSSPGATLMTSPLCHRAPHPLPLPLEVWECYRQLQWVGRPLPPPLSVNRLLVQAPNWLGDAIMSLPVLKALKDFYPQAEITVMANPRVAPLFTAQPEVSSVFPFPCKGLDVRSLRSLNEGFQVAVILPNSFASALSLFLARIPHRWGYAADGRRLLLTMAVVGRRKLRGLHLVYYYLGLLTGLGEFTAFNPPRLMLTQEDLQEAKDLTCGNLQNEDKPLVGLAPGAAYGPAKRWPAERFAALGQALQEEFQARLVLLGGPEETPLAQAVSKLLGDKVLNLTGRTSLRQALGVLAHLKLLITNDSGLMHAAAALGTPLVALFGSTNPRVTGPFSAQATVLYHPLPCSPCRKRTCPAGRDYECLKSITVAEVVAAARPWLEQGPTFASKKNGTLFDKQPADPA